MTIGIAASGPRAGLAIFHALAAVERVASGSIGGFVAFVALGGSGEVYRADTQRGGTSTLFVEGDVVGVSPPLAVAQSNIAGLMSSGPNRPEPLAQFVPAEKGVGLVTGHRLPNAPSITGRPLNLEVLDRLRDGMPANQAAEEVLQADPDADAGIIAVDRGGSVFGANSSRVLRRWDLGEARRMDKSTGAQVVVMHNAIQPAGSLAALAADIAMAVMIAGMNADGYIEVSAGTPLTFGPVPRVLVDIRGKAVAVETPDTRVLEGQHNCAAIYLGATVVCDGVLLGEALFEPNVIVDGGRIVSMNGQSSCRIGYRATTRPGDAT